MICSRCKRHFDPSVSFCPDDKIRLEPSGDDTAGDGEEAEQETIMAGSLLDVEGESRHVSSSSRVLIHYHNPRPGEYCGEYRIQEQIGEGGMALIYRAEHPFSGKLVAIKLLNPRLPKETEAVARFIQEARAVQLIGHRNIIDIISFEQLPDGRHYYVMEYLKGMTLKLSMEQQGAMTSQRVMPVLRAVASALDAAHARGIVHRDLKPDNIFLLRSETPDHMQVKLLDFGAAKLVEDVNSVDDDEGSLHTQDGVVLGTPDYMSPEQCNGEDLDHRSDIYSLGVVAYQMFTGVLPFTGGKAFEVMARRLMEAAPPPSSKSSKVSPALDAPLLKALERDPNLRYQRAGELVAAIEAALKPLESAPTLPASPSEASGRPVVEGKGQGSASVAGTKNLAAIGNTPSSQGNVASAQVPPERLPVPVERGGLLARVLRWFRRLFSKG